MEKNAALVNAIKRNLRELSLGGEYEILAMEAARAIRKLQNRGENLDVIFADPPYERDFVREIFCSLNDGNVLSEDGVLIIQHSVREDVDEHYLCDFILTDSRRYGDTRLSFFKIKEKE